jgi:hypothetical protein
MWSVVARIVIGILLMVHGFAHWHITSAWKPKNPPRSRLLDRLGLAPTSIAPIGNFLWATALIAFNVAGLTVFANQGWWRPVAIAAAGISLLVILLLWYPGTVIGAVVDVAILVALLGAHWPPTSLVR